MAATMFGIGLTVRYRSGTILGQTGTTLDARPLSRGGYEYLVRWEDGTQGWFLPSNLQF